MKRLSLLLLISGISSCGWMIHAGTATAADTQELLKDASSKSKSAVQLSGILTPFFNRYCVDCHSKDDPEGSFSISVLPQSIADSHIAESWQNVLDALNASEMPPKEAEQPTADELEEAIESLTRSLYEARERLTESGRIVLRRLNRREYANTINDLLGVPVELNQLPEDDHYNGFDTVGKSQAISAPHFDQYYAVGLQSIETAMSLGNVESRTLRYEAEQEHRIGKTWMKWLKAGLEDYKADPDEFSARKGRFYDLITLVTLIAKVRGLPEMETGHLFGVDYTPKTKLGYAALKVPPGVGRFRVRIRAGLTLTETTDSYHLRTREQAWNSGVLEVDNLLGDFAVRGNTSDPEVIEFSFTRQTSGDERLLINLAPETSAKIHGGNGTKTGYRRLIRKRATEAVESGKINSQQPMLDISDYPTRHPLVWVDWIEIEGPLPPDPAPKIDLTSLMPGDGPEETDEVQRARQTIKSFAWEAFRHRQPDPTLVEGAVNLFRSIREDDASSYENSLAHSLAAVLSTPSFLYHVEKSVKDRSDDRLTDRELACRLSYFLWSSPPDAKLYELARQGRLSDPAVLRQQVERMLGDSRARDSLDAFLRQWLELDWIDGIVVNKKYREFSDTIRSAMKAETLEFFAELVREDLSAMNLIDSEFTMLNAPLASFYGIVAENLSTDFQRVALPEDSIRGGLLGQGAILTMTSTGDRTSPIHRGEFVATTLLGSPPPPPPPNVPQLEIDDGQKLSFRELLEKHSSTPQCASCHRRFDPYGFALENFDAIGLWRDIEHNRDSRGRYVTPNPRKGPLPPPLDVKVKLVNGETIVGPEGLKTHLMQQKDQFARELLKSLATYALGRPVGFADQAMLEQLQQRWQKKNYGMRSLIHLITESQAFQNY